MELEPISNESQDQNPDNVSSKTPETSQASQEAAGNEPEKKLSAADLLLEKLAKRKAGSESETLSSSDMKQIINEAAAVNITQESVAAQEIEQDDPEEEEEVANLKDSYADSDKNQLIDALKKLAENDDINAVKDDVESIKSYYYKLHKAEIAEQKAKFLEAGNQEKDFKADADPTEEIFKELYGAYREKRNKLAQEAENQKLENLKIKYEIISGIEKLVNSQETLNKTFDEFKILQKRWHETGLVPQSEVKKLWESYNYNVEKFYDFVKINKELRDLDLKKNTELKILLCEKAEELLLEPKVIKAFKELQKLHEQWREIGPALNQHKEELWERFKQATGTINKKHQEYFENIKSEQDNNYKAKTLICEKAEEIIAADYDSHKDWDAKSKEILELQKIWKLIGFAPKKFNNKVYERFRQACDAFFDKKRDFYSQNKESQDNNLQLKTDLCIQAEGLKDSTDWKKTTDLFIKLQQKWKTIGPVSRKHSDEIWQRFRAACNAFFDNKEKHFAVKDQEQDNNLKLKNEIIAEIENFAFGENDEENLAGLKKLQSRWSEVGHVNIKLKDDVQDRYRKAVDTQFGKLRIDEGKRNELKVKSLIDSIKSSDSAMDKLRAEKERLKLKVETLNQKITLWENNLGFFAKSKGADTMIADFRRKMEHTKNDINSLNNQISMINHAMQDIRRNSAENKEQ